MCVYDARLSAVFLATWTIHTWVTVKTYTC